MTTLPAVAPPDPESALMRCLSSSCASLKIARDPAGAWSVAAGEGATADGLRAGLKAFDDAMRGGPLEEITPELTALISVTRRPNHIDDKRAIVYFMAIQKAMMDYPLDVVHRALEDWRKSPDGEWWPAEAELRRLCDRLVAPRYKLRRAAIACLADLEEREERDAREKARGPSYFATGPLAEFREAMRKKMRPRAFDTWFHPADMKFEGRTILVRSPTAVDVLNRDGREELARLNLTVRFSAIVFANEPPRKSEEPTPEERAAIVAELRALATSLRMAGLPKAEPRAPVEEDADAAQVDVLDEA